MREPVRLQQHEDRQRDQRGKRQVELKPQRREHHERRGPEDDRGDDPLGAPRHVPPKEIHGRHAEAEERENHRLRPDRIRWRQPVHERGSAGHHGRIEGRSLEDPAEISPRHVGGAVDDPLEVIGVVPLRWRAIDRQPDRRERRQSCEGARDDRALARHGGHRRVERNRAIRSRPSWIRSTEDAYENRR